MHEYVPESGTKTVQSLMAAGVRELVRPNRLAYLQRIVCNLNTFKEMRALRFQLASAPLSSTEDKVKFFKNAFNMANRLLFMEAQPLPSTSANDSVFEIFLASGKAIISSEQTRTQTPVPLRSQRPTSLSHIHHCTTTNVLLSVLIANANCDDQKPGGEYILEQLNPTDINSTLQVLRADGLIARPRVAVTDQTMQYKNQATLSHYFRHFFGHRFHVDLIEQINQIRSYLDDINDNGGELADLEDYAGTVLIATDSFYNKNEIELDIDDALIQMFTEAANQNSTKQIRYLESTDLHLERVHVVLTNPDDPDSLPTMKEITSLLDTSIPEDAIQARPLEEWLAEVFTTDADDKEMRSVTMAIQATEAYGVNLSDLQTTTNLPFDKLVPIIEKLRDGFQIIEAGVDTKRYVWHTYADAWTVVVDGKRLCPRPWIQPAGSICLSTARWMLEALLMAVVNKPGIQKKDLQFRFEFALQPVALEQLIKVLTYCECLVENFEAYEAMQFSGPFEAAPSQTVVHTLEPTVQAIQRFASIFRDVQPIHLLTSGLQSFATEDLGLNDTNSTGKKDVPLLTAPTPMEEI
ncbi:unnamed protein product, partial [Mesorhabditis belari]|uniref:Uncharacterized protein n=1 Tax=Mesorhabditis belari TaxID=2138241 RepID=A0AAF3FNG0_9BILA